VLSDFRSRARQIFGGRWLLERWSDSCRGIEATTCSELKWQGTPNVSRIVRNPSDAFVAILSRTVRTTRVPSQPPTPTQVVDDATIVRMENGAMKTLKQGTNQWTCMVADPDVPMCMDPNAMEWAHAWQTHGQPTTKTGFIYMLAGDTGASNTDPWASKQTPDNHWLQTGSHVMIVGAAASTMAGYPRNADPDPTKMR
jgi:hypothetical protein